MVSKKVTNKNKPSITRFSAAKYLTFVAASAGGVEENSAIQNFRITAKDEKNSSTSLNLNHQRT